MTIPNEAVEAARTAFVSFPLEAAENGTLDLFRAALEAAAPFLMSQALRDMADELDLGYFEGWHSDRLYAGHLRSKADDISTKHARADESGGDPS